MGTKVQEPVEDRAKWWVQEMVQYLQSDDSLKYGLGRGTWRLAQGKEYIQELSPLLSPEEMASLSDIIDVAGELANTLEPVMRQLELTLSDIRKRLVGPSRM